MRLQEMQRHFWNLPDRIEEKIEECSKAVEEFETLDKMLKPVLAQQACKHEGAEATRERLARSSKEYIAHVKALGIAKGKMSLLFGQKAVLEKKFEAARTLISLEKNKMKIL